ncbi:MAG: PPC domain-containing protein, partial [Flavobacterium sp.]|uniref:PPC domain-containing protein n=1 Tax=Flavobacterium sp. TaxID=239 RepID=UPI0037BE1F2D
MKKNPLGCIFPTFSFAKSIKLFSLLFAFVFYTNDLFAQGTTCATATPLTINGACDAGTINDVTQNNPTATGCSFNTFRREGWYTFTVTGGPLNITITADAADRDLFLQLISSSNNTCGGTLTQINCANTTQANGAQTETITTSLANGTYYIKVINNRNNNDMILNSICVTSSIDPCASATNIASCGTLVNTTIAAGTGSFGTSACSFTTGGIERVFTFTPATTGAYTIQQASSFAYIDYQFRTVASGCAAAGWTCIDDLSGASNSPSFTLTGGVQYYLLLDPESTAGGNISFTIGCPIVAPSNDDCNNAIPLTLNTSCSYSNYTTAGATASTTPSTPPVPGCASYSGGDVWFSFLVPANGEVTVDTQTGGMTDSGMAWYTGTCGALSLLECDDDDSANGLMSSITRTGLTPGTTIYARFWEYSNDNPGTFGICATSPGPCTTPGAQANGFTPGTITSTSFPAT